MTALIITDQALVGMGVAHEFSRIAPRLKVACISSVTAALAFLVDGATEVCCAVVDLDIRDSMRMREVIALRSVLPTLPLIVLTSHRREHEVSHARELECAAYLEKSADLGALATALTAVLFPPQSDSTTQGASSFGSQEPRALG